jgi:hypothetical protein
VVDGGADFSRDRVYRYRLWRTFESGEGTVTFIGLNPSTADETNNDPTVRRCMGFAYRWDFQRFVMLNIFGFRSTDPRPLTTMSNPTGPENDEWIQLVVGEASLVVAAWGNQGSIQRRGAFVRQSLDSHALHHLGLTVMGYPRHPLYVRGDTQPIVWERGCSRCCHVEPRAARPSAGRGSSADAAMGSRDTGSFTATPIRLPRPGRQSP